MLICPLRWSVHAFLLYSLCRVWVFNTSDLWEWIWKIWRKSLTDATNTKSCQLFFKFIPDTCYADLFFILHVCICVSVAPGAQTFISASSPPIIVVGLRNPHLVGVSVWLYSELVKKWLAASVSAPNSRTGTLLLTCRITAACTPPVLVPTHLWRGDLLGEVSKIIWDSREKTAVQNSDCRVKQTSLWLFRL